MGLPIAIALPAAALVLSSSLFAAIAITVRRGEIETGQIETSLMRASVSLKKIETDLLGSWWP